MLQERLPLKSSGSELEKPQQRRPSSALSAGNLCSDLSHGDPTGRTLGGGGSRLQGPRIPQETSKDIWKKGQALELKLRSRILTWKINLGVSWTFFTFICSSILVNVDGYPGNLRTPSRHQSEQEAKRRKLCGGAPLELATRSEGSNSNQLLPSKRPLEGHCIESDSISPSDLVAIDPLLSSPTVYFCTQLGQCHSKRDSWP
jgi:hypothetical protein